MQRANFRFKKHRYKSGLIQAEISRVISNLKWKETGKLSQYVFMHLLLLHKVRFKSTSEEEFSTLIAFKR